MADGGRGAETALGRGKLAEGMAALFLEATGHRILARNARHGRLEIDLIVARGDCVAFVEVRARSSGGHGRPEETVRWRKRRRVEAAAAGLLQRLDLPGGVRLRFDVVAVELEPFGARLRHLRDFWRPR
jgi:putative endonuclease